MSNVLSYIKHPVCGAPTTSLSPRAHDNMHRLPLERAARETSVSLFLHIVFPSLLPRSLHRQHRAAALPSSLQLGPSVSLFLLSLAHEERHHYNAVPLSRTEVWQRRRERVCASRAEAGPRGGDCGKILMPPTTPQRAGGAQPAATGAGTRARARLPAFTLQVSFTGFAKNISLGRREKIRRRPPRRRGRCSRSSSFLTVACVDRDAKSQAARYICDTQTMEIKMS